MPGILTALAVLVSLSCARAPTEPPLRLTELSIAAGGRPPERCEMGGDSRESIVLAPGEELAFTVKIPASGTLHYALAVGQTGVPAPPWQLHVDDPQGSRMLTTTEEVPGDRWDAYRLDLARFAGQVVVIRVHVAAASEGAAGRLCWANPVLAPRDRPGPLAVVVLLDTVRADHLGLYGYARPTTPALAALGRDGIVVDDMASDAPWTRASVATLFTGQGSLTHGVLSRDAHLEPRWPTLAERVRAAGYGTVAFSTNPNVLPFWGFAPGFDRFVDVGAESWTENSDAATVLDAALAAVDEAGREPLLLYLHLNDAHAPYDPPPFEATALLGAYDPASPGKTLSPKASPAEVRGALDRYDAEIAYLDAQLGAFHEALRSRGRYEENLIVVVGDHGEEFLDHGGIYHGHTLFREVLDVPLIFKLPHGAGAGRHVTAASTMRDVLPTVLAALALPTEGLPGRVLVAKDGAPTVGSSLPRFAVTDMDHATAYAVENDGFELIQQTRPRPGTWLFERKTDPSQHHNLAGSVPLERSVSLQRLLDERLLAARAGWHVRACGGPAASTATVHLTSGTPLVRLERVDLEQDDQVDLSGSATDLTWQTTLAPQSHQEERFGKLVAITRPDRDELVFGNAGPLTTTFEGGARILVGGSARPVPAGMLTLTTAEADAPPVYAPTCPPEPALLIWHAGSAEAATPADPDLERRLRAIGYLQ